MPKLRLLNLLLLTVFLTVPVAVLSAPLDDYYLARFAAVYSPNASRSAGMVTGDEERCLTPLFHDVKRDWKVLDPETRKAVAKYLDRPTDPWTQQNLPVSKYQSPHFTVYYTTAGKDAADPGWAAQVAAVFEEVYTYEVTTLGYRAPPLSSSDGRYAVYLADLAAAFQYGYTQSDVPAPTAATPYGFASYMALDKAFTAAIYTQPDNSGSPTYTPLESLQITAAHEFHHMIQYGYNFYFDTWFAESTSTWLEDETYDGVNQLYTYLPAYFRATTSSIHIPPNVSTGGGYGRWIFDRFLVERYGSPDVVKKYWEKLASVAPPSDTSDIPALPVLAQIVAQWSAPGNLSDDFLAFAKRTYKRTWTSHLSESSLMPAIVYQSTSYPNGTSPVLVPVVNLPSLSFAYYRYVPAAGSPQDLVLLPGTLPAGVVAVAMKKQNGSPPVVTEYAPAANGSVTVPAFSSSTEVVLLLCNTTFATAPAVNPTPTNSGGGDPVVPAGDGGGGGCFIATAAYGSYLHPKVQVLREFRDSWLLTNAPGRSLVACYYRLSPPLARLIAGRPTLRVASRVMLTPVVWGVGHKKMAIVSSVAAFLLVQQVVVVRRGVRRRKDGE